jgi:hypothetical protein
MEQAKKVTAECEKISHAKSTLEAQHHELGVDLTMCAGVIKLNVR